MYGDVVHRTQIYLADAESVLLSKASSRTGASRSELIRRAVRTVYGTASTEGRLAALRASAGIWGDEQGSGAYYADDARRDLDDRLDQAGLR